MDDYYIYLETKAENDGMKSLTKEEKEQLKKYREVNKECQENGWY